MRSIITAFILLSLLSCKSRMPVTEAPLAVIVEGTTVTPENVMEASLYLPGDENADSNETHRDNYRILASHIQIDIIDKALFEDKQRTAMNFWLEDTAGATKTDSVLTIKARDTILTFTDNTTETERHATYSYEGQFPVINQYVVLGTLYEEYGYMFFDKNTGKNTATFSAFPLISPDQKLIVSLYANIYAPQTGNMSVYRYHNGVITNLFEAGFKNWMPQESFYNSDGYLYVSVNHPKQYWLPDGEINDEHQYLRIKIL